MWKSILGKVTLQHKSIERRADMQKAETLVQAHFLAQWIRTRGA